MIVASVCYSFQKIPLKFFPHWKFPRHPLLMGITFFTVLLLTVLPSFSQQPIRLKVLIQALESSQWRPLLVHFQQENPNIHLELVEAPNDTNLVEDLYTSAFLLGDSPYDLVYMDVVWLPKFAAAGWLQDL